MFTWDLLPPLDLFRLVHLDPTSQPVGKLVVSLRLNGLVVTARNSRCVYHSFCTQGGACVAKEGMCGKGWRTCQGACMAEGHAWRGGGWGGVACRRDDHLSGRYASYWNAFLFRHAIYFTAFFKLRRICGDTLCVRHKNYH